MPLSLADHVRLAREAWEVGHSLSLAALASLALEQGVQISADQLPDDAGTKVSNSHRELIRHLRPLEPYMSGLPLVDEIQPWVIGNTPITIASQKYGQFVVPWLASFIDQATEDTWRTAEAQMQRHADEWRTMFDLITKAVGGSNSPVKRPASTNALMIDEMGRNPASKDWTLEQWSRHLNRSKSAIFKTKSWKAIVAGRAAHKSRQKSRGKRRYDD